MIHFKGYDYMIFVCGKSGCGKTFYVKIKYPKSKIFFYI